MRGDSGFTLVEFLIYIGLFAILAVIFSTILLTYTRVNLEQTARSEVAAQLNFALQTIQQSISNAGAAVVRDTIDGGSEWDEEDSGILGNPQSYLVLKTRDEGGGSNDPSSPMVIFAEDGFVKIRRGRGTQQSVSNLTTDKVLADNLTFTKFQNAPGREVIEVDLSLSFNSENPQQQVSRKLVLGVGKAEAAVFDTSLLPGNNVVDVGQGTQRWRDGYFSNNLSVDNQVDAAALIVGGGTIVNAVHRGKISVDPPSISAGSRQTFTLTPPTTITAGDNIFLTPPPDLEAGLFYIGARTNVVNNNIELTLSNITGSAINGASRNWDYLLIK